MARKVRSGLYHNAATLNETFREHLGHIWGFSNEQRKILVQSLPSLLASVTGREDMLVRERIVAQLGGDAQKALQALQVLTALSSLWNPAADNAKIAMQDIEVLHVLPDDQKQRKLVRDFLRQVFMVFEQDSKRRLRLRTAGSILPNLKNCETAIDLRRIIKSSFDWRSEMPEKYRPAIAGIVPIALLRFKLSEGDPIVFQCEKEDIEMLIRKLHATLKEMDHK